MIPAISVDQAIARLEATIAEVGVDRAALATDGDGTLWTHDVGEALFDEILEAGLVGEPARAALLAEADAHGVNVADRSDPTAIARTLFDAYVALRFPEDRMCAAMAWCMAGMRAEVLAAFCDDVLLRSFRLRERWIAESHELLRWAAARSLPIWLVSASPFAVVDRAAALVADAACIAPPRVIAMTPRLVEGVIAPAIEGIWPYGEGKRTALLSALEHERRVVVAAMGDNVFDAPMLRLSHLPLAIRPKPALARVAAEIPGLLRLAGQ